MSIFNKIAKFLFEETETEIVAEDELETVSFSQNKAQDKTVKKDTASQEQQKTPVNTINEEPKQDEKKFVSIEVEKKPKTKPVKKESEKIVLPKKEYEQVPVISPMFGATEEKQPVKKKAAVKPAPKHTAKKVNPLGTIISPYFGAEELEEFEEEAKKDIEIQEKIEKEDILDTVQENMEFNSEEDIKNVSLDDLIEEDEDDSLEKDMLQISLFGDSTPVKSVETMEKEEA